MRRELPTRDPGKRRQFLQVVASSAGLALVGCASTSTVRGSPSSVSNANGSGKPEEAEVTPREDLMQEHGVLERILLLCDEAVHRIDERQRLDLAVIAHAASIVRRFVEDYRGDREHQLLGEHGFETAGAEVARLEAAFGIADLARVTAPA